MSDTERHPAQVAMGRKAAKLRAENEPRRQKQRHQPPESSRRDHKRRPQPQQRRRQDNARTEATDGDEGGDDGGEPDSLVPDRIVAQELGTSVMSLWRRTNDPDDDFPAPIKINGRNFRSRKQLEAYKARKLKEAMRHHELRLNVRRRVPLPVS